MRHSLCSFTFCIKECKRTLLSFWFHKSYKNDWISQKKERKRTVQSFLRLKKNLTIFFAIYMYLHRYISLHIYILYISIYRYISVYIYIYLYLCIDKKECNFLRSFSKDWNVLAFFYVLCKRMKCSLRSFTFFAKELCILCVLLRS